MASPEQKARIENYDLGVGKSSVVKRGSLNTTYQITVPRCLVDRKKLALRTSSAVTSRSAVCSPRSWFLGGFSGLTRKDFTIDEPKQTIITAHQLILSGFTNSEKDRVVSIYASEPQRDNSPISHIQNLPAVNWKPLNIAKMPREKRATLQQALKEILDL